MKRFFRGLLIISLLSFFGGETIAQTKTTSPKTAQKKISNFVTSSDPIPCSKENKIIPVKASEIDKPLKIISKPRALRTTDAHVQGVVRLRVTFLDCGKIGAIQPVSGLPFGLTESAVEAAKKIRFEPAMKNGKAINITKIVEYAFTFY